MKRWDEEPLSMDGESSQSLRPRQAEVNTKSATRKWLWFALVAGLLMGIAWSVPDMVRTYKANAAIKELSQTLEQINTETAARIQVGEGVARQAGRIAGQFGVGATDAMRDSQARWVTIKPQTKDQCLAASNGVLDNSYVRCRNGWQEYVRIDSNGNKQVLRERPIPH